jgi:hypothetical protein
MQLDRPEFWAAPFPSDDLVQEGGTVAVAGFPNPSGIAIVEQARGLVAHDARGFSLAGGVFLPLTGPIDPAPLPDMAASVAPGASVFLIGVTPGAPDRLKRYPVEVRFTADGGPFGAPNMLSLVPLQGVALAPKTTYAAVVTKRAGVAQGDAMAAIAAGARPPNVPSRVFDAYTRALATVGEAGVDARDVAGLAVFTTDAPTAAFDAVRADALARPLPLPAEPPAKTDVFDGYCVYSTTLDMPDYQTGTPPFSTTGGTWTFDGSGAPVVARTETARLVLTVPRAPMPAAGYPLVVFVRTGGGGDRPLVDRGTQATTDGPPITPGTGPARYFAEVGFAGASIDGPLGGLRNTTHGDEQFLVFNVFNGPALRDNVRESAVELVVFAHVLEGLSFDASDCPGAPASPAKVKFDASRFTIMGHSMGATIAPLAIAFEPSFRAAVLSGAGASWIANVLYKQKPLGVKGAFEDLLGYVGDERELTAADPVLTLFQWAIEPADPLVYASRVAPRHVLMEQGIVDHYIMPHIANAMSLSLGLDLAGPSLDGAAPELAGDTPLASVLSFSGRRAIPLPAFGNAAGGATAVVVQHPADGIEDGHEVAFQTEAPKHEYKCFLASFAAGSPSVSNGGAAEAPCP